MKKKRNIFLLTLIFAVLMVVFMLPACTTGSGGGVTPDETPGTIEDKGNPDMGDIEAAHTLANPDSDEMVVYYYRKADPTYGPWGLWLWAITGGDGSKNWSVTQDFQVLGNVAYMKFKPDGTACSDADAIPLLGESVLDADNKMGIIVRQDAGWTKDGASDRVWDFDNGNECVIFSGDDDTYPYGTYVPSIKQATMETKTTMKLVLSGKHALETKPSSNGFVITNKDDSSDTVTISDMVNYTAPTDRSDNYTDTILVTLSSDIDITKPYQISHPKYFAALQIDTSLVSVTEAEKTVPATDYELGAVYSSGSVEFRLWSPFATSVTANLYNTSLDGTSDTAADYTVSMTKNATTGVWTGTFNTVDPDGYFYDYTVVTAKGTKLCLDPYAKSMDAFTYDSQSPSSGRGAIIDTTKTAALPTGGWGSDTDYALAKPEDAIIYEMSVRDFTISSDSGVSATKGTYAAFAEKLSYLSTLGVTHIQLMPVLNFYYNDETDKAYEGTSGSAGTTSSNNYNWGYDPHNYFTPEGWYSTDATDPYKRVQELKDLIKAIHAAGMGVLLDVVYNHLGNYNVLDDIVPNYYFRLNADGTKTSASGCGNDVASTHSMARKLIVDSCKYWVDQYKIDGFRFDLMGLIDTKTILDAQTACAALTDKADILFEGEGWKMYNGPSGTTGMTQSYMTSTDKVAVFNDEIRDLLKAGGYHEEGKGLITDKATTAANITSIFNNLIGQPQSNYTADDPADSMVYIAAHDGLTLHDTISHNSDATNDAGIIARAKLGNFLVLTSQSIAFMHGGQECGRTKPAYGNTSEVLGNFVKNSYDSSDSINQFVWTLSAGNQGLHDYTKGLIAIRKANAQFTLGDQTTIDSATTQITSTNTKAVGYVIDNSGTKFFVLCNASKDTSADFDCGEDVSSATCLVDDDEAFNTGVSTPSGFSVSTNTVTVSPLSAVLLKK